MRETKWFLSSRLVSSRLVSSRLVSWINKTNYILTQQKIYFDSLLANPVEWQMNDDLLQAETDGKLKINRAPAFVACVSNFSNFLDLFRKTLRNLELGVPVVVLSRTNTSQHCFRWFEILLDLIKEETNISPGMLTFASVHPDNIQHIFDSVSDDCPMLMTCSRDLAKLVKKGKSNVIASTGGPNTLVTNNLDAISDAVKVSAGIENSGQCTAMRHVVVGGINHNNRYVRCPLAVASLFVLVRKSPEKSYFCVFSLTIQFKLSLVVSVSRTEIVILLTLHLYCSNILDGNHVSSLFDTIDVVEGPGKSLMEGKFAGVFEDAPFFPGGLPRGYVAHEKVDMAYKVNEPGELPPKNIDEHWRRVVLDFSQKSDGSAIKAKDDFTDKLATWLVENQPISVAVNDDGNYDLLKYIWERTGGVVYTGGSIENPALTCQARPQEGEIFGEFPVRKDLRQYSKFPVVVPSPTAAYNATYREEYLLRKRGESLPDYVKNYIKSCEDDVYKGYLMEMGEYLLDATMDGPRHGCGERTALWGLQRPPVDGAPTVFKVKDDVKNFDELSVKLLPFFMTNARKSAVVVVEGGDKNGDLSKKLQKAGVTDKMDVRFKKFLGEEFFNEVVIGKAGEEIELAMVGQFVSLYLCVGHVKSTKGGDEEFIKAFSGSEKWLRVNKQ